MLLYAWDMLEQADDACVTEGGESDWLNLAGRLLDSWFHSQARRGLETGYTECSASISGVRGRIEIGPTVRRQLLSLGKAVCTFDELSTDTPANRVIKAAITLIARSETSAGEVREMMMRCLHWVKAVRTTELTEAACRAVQTHSNNRSYRFPIAVAHLIAANRFPDENGKLAFGDFARDDGPLAGLFEAFVRNFLQREQSNLSASSRHLSWPVTQCDALAQSLLPTMRTDVSLEREGLHAVVDAKYYNNPLSSYRGSTKFRSDHLFQLAAYLDAIAAGSELETCGMLMYAQPRDCQFDASFTLKGRRVRVRTLDLSAEWQSIRSELLGIADWAAAVAN